MAITYMNIEWVEELKNERNDTPVYEHSKKKESIKINVINIKNKKIKTICAMFVFMQSAICTKRCLSMQQATINMN